MMNLVSLAPVLAVSTLVAIAVIVGIVRQAEVDPLDVARRRNAEALIEAEKARVLTRF